MTRRPPRSTRLTHSFPTRRSSDLDASRSVPVAAALLSPEQKPKLLATTNKDYEEIRERHANKDRQEKFVTLDEARANRTPIDWAGYRPPRPRLLLQQAKDVCNTPDCDHRHHAATQFVKTLRDYPLAELREYIRSEEHTSELQSLMRISYAV